MWKNKKSLAKKTIEKQLDSAQYLKGTLEVTLNGNAHLISNESGGDVFVHSSKLNTALNKDKVEIEVYYYGRKKRKEGRVIRIIKRYKTSFSGVLETFENHNVVIPSDFRIQQHIAVHKKDLGTAQKGDKVVVEITDWKVNKGKLRGVIKDVLGTSGEHNAEIKSILVDYGLPEDFTADIEGFAHKLDSDISAKEILKRRDMRQVLTFTIDPKDAKDFDDALSFQVLSNGNYRVGVHIADVTHFLEQGSILDEEAYRRATSIYLVDRVVPMLPEVLSNGVCSLSPNQEKYTFSAVFDVDANGNILKEWFGETIIYSDARFCYEEAQHIIETKNNNIPKGIALEGNEYCVNENIFQAILTLNTLAKIMRAKRMKAGSISFDKIEVKFLLDKYKNPTEVYFKQAKEANHLIEEFMLLANKRVAEFIAKKSKKTFIYRVHDQPDADKINILNGVINRLGYAINTQSKKTISRSLNKILKDVKGKKEQNLVDTLTIRSMSKAKYTTKNIGHYGLAFDYYTHFTSPIRRYPDVITHRLLKHYLKGGKGVESNSYENFCKHCSSMEEIAVNAERHSVKYMQLRFMQNHNNKIFLGIISGVTHRGLFVELTENKCEGLVRIKDIKNDHYIYNSSQFTLEGIRTKKIYRLGDEIKVCVKSIDLEKRHLNFDLA